MARSTTARHILQSRSANARLLRDGICTQDLLSSDRAARLRARFISEFPELRERVELGIHTDMDSSDQDFRLRASTMILDELGDVAAGLFRGFMPFMTSFLLKWPGPQTAVNPHRDWMYVNEQNGARTFVVWIALEDICGHNGQLRVARGSHTLDTMLRGTDLNASWLGHCDVIEERLLDVPTSAGQAVVFDNALVHASHPNHSGRPRLSVAIALRRTSDRLVHYVRRDDRHADLYEVDEVFFRQCQPARIAEDMQGAVAKAIEDVGSLDLSEDQLARRLDGPWLAKLDRLRRLGNRWQRSPGYAVKRLFRDTISKGTVQVAERLEGSVRGGPCPPGFQRAEATCVVPASTKPRSRGFEPAWEIVRREAVAQLRHVPRGPTFLDRRTTGGTYANRLESFVLFDRGCWDETNRELCPETVERLSEVPGLVRAHFRLMTGQSHIAPHDSRECADRRYELGLIIPEVESACAVGVEGRVLTRVEGSWLSYSTSGAHEAWNWSRHYELLLVVDRRPSKIGAARLRRAIRSDQRLPVLPVRLESSTLHDESQE